MKMYIFTFSILLFHSIYVDSFVRLTVNRVGSGLITSNSEEGLFETIKVFELLNNKLRSLGRDNLIPILEKYSMHPSLLTYFDSLECRKRFIYGFKFLPIFLYLIGKIIMHENGILRQLLIYLSL